MSGAAMQSSNGEIDNYTGNHESKLKKYLSSRPGKQQPLYLKLAANRGFLLAVVRLNENGNIEVEDLETNKSYRSLSALRGVHRTHGAGGNSWEAFQNGAGVSIGTLIGGAEDEPPP